MSNYQRVSNITYFFDLDNRSVWGEGAQLAGLTNHHQRISPFGSKNMAIGYPNISTSPCWSISIPFFDANIRCFAGSSFFCLGTTPYAMAAQPFMVTIHQYPHFLLVVSPYQKSYNFVANGPFSSCFSICFRFWSRQIASPNSRCGHPHVLMDIHPKILLRPINPGWLQWWNLNPTMFDLPSGKLT